MDFLNYVEIIAATAGLALTILLCVFPRFGEATWIIVLMLLHALAASAIQGIAPIAGWMPEDCAFLTFACFILCVAAGCLATYSLERADFRSNLKMRRWLFVAVPAGAPILVVALYLLRPTVTDSSIDFVALGLGGYAGAAYLLLVSVIALANIEQTLRSAQEHIRWEIKFLLLGIGSICAAIIYIASQVLLYPPEYVILPLRAVRVFPVIFLLASVLIFQSWRRYTGRGRIVVSHGIVYSSITLFSVGIYLVGSSLIARWLAQWAGSELSLEPVIFLVAAIALTVVLLGTSFRHNARRWIRRNVFTGRYDYRQLWMDAAEKVRSTDSPTAAAAALAQLIHDALGSIDITVWLRVHNSRTLRLAAARGAVAEAFNEEDFKVLDIPAVLNEPLSDAVPELQSNTVWPEEAVRRAKASLLVPLISSGRVVGLLTIGADRSGRPFDAEAREFLRVLAIHAASEFHKSELLESLVANREAEAFQTFATFLLHDLKNFASTLSLIAKNAVRHHANPDFQLDAFRSIVNTADKMKHLCNGLRTFSTTLAANKKLDDLNNVVLELVSGFDENLSHRLQLQLSPVPRAFIDRQELSRVLQNLILNANEACPAGPIELATRADSGKLVICVRDKGKGIPKDFLQNKLFQPFHTTKGDGLGIGLFQSKKIIEAHNGTIDIESQEGEGTVVRIVIPLAEYPDSSIQSIALNADAAAVEEQRPLRQAAVKS